MLFALSSRQVMFLAGVCVEGMQIGVPKIFECMATQVYRAQPPLGRTEHPSHPQRADDLMHISCKCKFINQSDQSEWLQHVKQAHNTSLRTAYCNEIKRTAPPSRFTCEPNCLIILNDPIASKQTPRRLTPNSLISEKIGIYFNHAACIEPDIAS